jgi:hypothetical protein
MLVERSGMSLLVIGTVWKNGYAQHLVALPGKTGNYLAGINQQKKEVDRCVPR